MADLPIDGGHRQWFAGEGTVCGRTTEKIATCLENLPERPRLFRLPEGGVPTKRYPVAAAGSGGTCATANFSPAFRRLRQSWKNV